MRSTLTGSRQAASRAPIRPCPISMPGKDWTNQGHRPRFVRLADAQRMSVREPSSNVISPAPTGGSEMKTRTDQRSARRSGAFRGHSGWTLPTEMPAAFVGLSNGPGPRVIGRPARRTGLRGSGPMAASAAPGSSSRAAQAAPAIIEELHEKYMRKGVLSLAAGVSYRNPPQVFFDDAIAAISDGGGGIHRYGDVIGDSELLNELTEKLRIQNGITGRPVMVTAGANQAFVNVLLAIGDPGDEIVLTRPYYFSHLVAIQLAGLCPVVADPDDALLPSVPNLAQSLTAKTKAVVLVNPGNPSGAVAGPSLVRSLEQLCVEKGIYLISDEAYEGFVYDGAEHTTPTDANHVINIFTMSKSFALAGWRVGYLVYPPELESAMLKINDTIPTHACRLSQKIAAAALSREPTFPAKHARELNPCREAIWVAVRKFGCIRTAGAFYFFVPVPGGHDDVDAVRFLAVEYDVLVVPGVAFGMPGFLRVSYASLPFEKIKIAAYKLQLGLSALANKELELNGRAVPP